MASYRVREGTVTAANSFTALDSLYGQSTSTSVQVPANTSAIVGIIAAVSQNSATEDNCTFGIQLTEIRTVYAPYSQSGENVASTPLEGYIDVAQAIYPAVNTGTIGKDGEWTGAVVSDNAFRSSI